MVAIQAVRTLVFYALFIGQTAILAITVALIAIIWRRRTVVSWWLADYWRRSNLFLLRWIVGIKTEVTGAEQIPPGPCIIAAKHQSDWDIFALLPATLGKPAFIAKRELMDIPFFGWAARSLDTISIDRKLGGRAVPAMVEDARDKIARGCRIVIYPEGTRKAPLAPADYRQGVVRLYLALGVPVIPVALDSGLYWGRNSLVMWPGTARAHFLAPIEPGLSAETFTEMLRSAIETETTTMIVEAVERGISRPLTDEFRARLRDATTPQEASGDR